MVGGLSETLPLHATCAGMISLSQTIKQIILGVYTVWDPLSEKLWSKGFPGFGIFWILGPLAKKKELFYPEDGHSMLFRNADNVLTDYIVSPSTLQKAHVLQNSGNGYRIARSHIPEERNFHCIYL
jgi:hypothetical protein